MKIFYSNLFIFLIVIEWVEKCCQAAFYYFSALGFWLSGQICPLGYKEIISRDAILAWMIYSSKTGHSFFFSFSRTAGLPSNSLTFNLVSRVDLFTGKREPFCHNLALFPCQIYFPLSKNWPAVYFNSPFLNTMCLA